MLHLKLKNTLKFSVGISLRQGALLFFIEGTVEWISDIEIDWLIPHDFWNL